MAKHKFQKALARLLREIVQLFKTLTGQFVRWFLRNILVTKRWQKGQAGFVLPTVVFMLMVVALVVAAILFRTFTRTAQVIQQGQTQIIQNAATPAIDRAKSKLEYLFDKGLVVPGIPGDKDIEEAMFADSIYSLPDEKRVTLDGVELDTQDKKVNAWYYDTDTDGKNGADIRTIYAIVTRAERTFDQIYTVDPNPPEEGGVKRKYISDEQDKVKYWLVRNGPLATNAGGGTTCPNPPAGGGNGWFDDPSEPSSGIVKKSFQVYAVSVPYQLTQPNAGAVNNPGIATLQYQQDRTYRRGNTWGAWFRNDLELFPGEPFNWNGAIHSEGSLFFTTGKDKGKLRLYLISAPNSCFFNPPLNSDINSKQQFVIGSLGNNDSTMQGSQELFIDTQMTSEPYYNKIKVTNANDSVTPDSPKTIDIAIDPLKLLTQGISEPRNSTTDTWQSVDLDPEKLGKRVEIDEGKCPPYIDDTYRADDRYGPKPTYDRGKPDPKTGSCADPAPEGTIGEFINAGNDKLVRNDPPGPGLEQDVGLDGYWERRARNEGLRVIVGQRLELGNPFGWNVDVDDSDGDGNVTNDVTDNSATPPTVPNTPDRGLYAPTNKHTVLGPANRPNEGKQYTTLRDNLAAVQATAIYHHTHEKGDFPIAFVATTAHPGTQKTLENSTTFAKPTKFNTKSTADGGSGLFPTSFGDGNNEILSNFLIGEGTNGWAFDVVPGNTQTPVVFANLIDNSNSSLRIALNNLAHFAGDPNGFYPAKQESSAIVAAAGKVTHPYPNLTMWGNYSNLRETLRLMEKEGKKYDELSLADKSTLHTAAGSLGMLAYNISYLQDFKYDDAANKKQLDDPAIETDLVGWLNKLSDATTPGTGRGNGEIEIVGSDGNPVSATNPPAFIDVYKDATPTTGRIVRVPIKSTEPSAPPPEAFIAALEAQGATAADALELFKLLHLKEQVERDRRFGFRATPAPTTETATSVYQYKVNHVTDFTYAGVMYDKSASAVAIPGTKGNLINLGCDIKPANGNSYFGLFTDPSTATEEQEKSFIRLATSLCPTQPKFPSLYYVFPKYNHNHQGNAAAATTPAALDALYPGSSATTTDDYLQPGNPDLNTLPVANRPTPEPYIADVHDINKDSNKTELEPYITAVPVNGTYTYTVLKDTNSNRVEEKGENGIAEIALMPRTLTDWQLPSWAPKSALINVITDRTTNATAPKNNLAVPFLDKGMYDGRELMNVRVLDFDVDMLRQKTLNNNKDVWLPQSGLVYAFREDAMREDAIARPALGTWSAYETAWTTSKGNPAAANRMNVWTPVDPPMSSNNISPKSVDYYADPDRRSYGFRLRNGITLKREPASYDLGNGISMISDNPVYIQGDFNVHSTNATVSSRLEEFNDKIADVDLSTNPERFYTRGDTAGENPNTDFAKKDKDTWRPSEILADAVNILSNSWSECTDGTVQSGILANNSGTKLLKNAGTQSCDASTQPSSYQNGLIWKNSSYPLPTGGQWICENPFDPRTTSATATAGGCDGPIKIFRNGEIRYKPTTATPTFIDPAIANYRDFFDRNRVRNTPENTWVNTIMVSGIVPSRQNSANGGLHNFPRMHEDWQTTGKTLYFYGGLFQLSFNNYATGPYDQDAWEPATGVPNTDQGIWYYRAPKRRWGYDVALQSARAGQIAGRMVELDDRRNEFYRKLRADDLYICKLRQAIGYDCPK